MEIGRLIAAALVLAAHLIVVVNVRFALRGQDIFGGWTGGTALPLNAEGFIVYAGELAVQYFFVLSGFVMATAHGGDFGKSRAAPRFWWRRACRLYPTYWLALALMACANHFSWPPPATIVKTLLLSPWQDNFLIFTSWSLRYEVAFYIMFGLCLLPRIGKPLLACWIAVCLWRWAPPGLLAAVHLGLPGLNRILPATPNGRFFSFMEFYFFAGLAAGALFTRFNVGPRLSALLLAGGLVLLVLILAPLGAAGPYAAPPMAILRLALSIGAIILGLAGLERHGVVQPGNAAGRQGAVSYPLYILHLPLLALLANNLTHVKFAAPALYALFVLLWLLIYGFAALVARYFDQPVQSWLRGRSRRKPRLLA